MHRLFRFLLLLSFIGVAGFLLHRFNHSHFKFPFPFPAPTPRLTRPYGMAPAAFDGFVRACNNAAIHPWRIGQTIGDAPRSVGYHKRDGVLRYKGQKIDYTAALDVGTRDLTRPQINRFLEELAEQGFASFYREGPNWRGHEHIHAIYAPLKMKPQLCKQVREWNRKRRAAGLKNLSWQRRYRHLWKS